VEPFDHYTPRSLAEAVALLARLNRSARVIAGGSDLLLKMKAGVLRPEAVVNIKRLAELRRLEYEPATGLRLGALITLGALARSPLILAHYPALAEAAGLMASEQVRSFATVGGNLCNAAPSADMAPPLIVLGATAHIAGPDGERALPVEGLLTGPGRTALQPGELLVELRLPPPEGRATYRRHTPRECMDIAVAGVAVWLALDGEICRAARIALGAVAPTPIRARQAEARLVGARLTPATIQAAAELAAAESRPIDDIRASAAYRRRIIAVLTRRAIGALVAAGERVGASQ
jgi:carbon-monoxide dehydrogenase medium subunit